MKLNQFNNFLINAIIIAVITVGCDIVFHVFLTHPFETPQYFESKLFFAFLTAVIVLSVLKKLKQKYLPVLILIGGALFASFASAFYTYGAPHFNVPVIYPIVLNLEYNASNFAGWIAHAICFIIAVTIVIKFFYKKN